MVFLSGTPCTFVAKSGTERGFCAAKPPDELEKASGSADNMRRQIKDYLEDAASAKMAAEELRRENQGKCLKLYPYIIV